MSSGTGGVGIPARTVASRLVRAEPSGFDPVVATTGCVVFAVMLFLPAMLNDGDTLWQIRAGEWMLDHLAIPATDPFSFTAGQRPWAAHEWFSEILLALSYRAAGMAGVMALAAAAVGITAALLMHRLRRFLSGPYALAALVIALSNAAPSMLARPHLLAWPCLALWCGGLVAARARRAVPPLSLTLVMALWVNLHGSFMLGLLLPAPFVLEALLDPGADRRAVIASWATFIAAAWAAALLNPDGLTGVLFPFHMIRMRSLAWIGEWMPADFTHVGPLELTILGGLALGMSGKVRLPPIRLLMLLGLVHAALAHARNGPLLGIVGVLIVAEPLGRCLMQAHAATPRAPRRHAALAAAAGLLAVAALTARLALPLPPDRTGASFAAVLDQVPPSLRGRPVLNDYTLGGSLIFAGVRPFIDSRADLYGDAFLRDYQDIVLPDRAALDRALADYGIAWTIFPAHRPIVALLDQEPGWRRLVSADGLVVHVAEPGRR